MNDKTNNLLSQRIEALNTRRSRWSCWKHLIGLPGVNGSLLTQEQLDQWLEDTDRKLICDACGTDIYDGDGAMFCPRCKEYKYIVPSIAGWSWSSE